MNQHSAKTTCFYPALAWAAIGALEHGLLVSGEGGRVVAYNHKLIELLGLTSDAFEGSTSANFEQALTSSALDQGQVRAWMREVAGLRDVGSFRMRLLNGRVLECRSTPLNNAPGGPRSWSFRDVSEVERTLLELEDQAANQRADYERTPAMLHTSDGALRLVAVSDRFLSVLGYERREVLGRKWLDLLNPGSRAFAAWVVIPRLYEFGNCTDVPLQFLTKSGKAIRVLLTAAGERDEKGELRRVMSLMFLRPVEHPPEAAHRSGDGRPH